MTKNKQEGIKPTPKKPKIEIYCKNPNCFTQYLATHKIKEVKSPNEQLKEKILKELKINNISWDKSNILKAIDLAFQEKDKQIEEAIDKIIEFREMEQKNNNIYRKSCDSLNEDFIDELEDLNKELLK